MDRNTYESLKKQHELLKSSYDDWISPISLDLAEAIDEEIPKHYGNIYFDPISTMIIDSFKAKDPVFKNLSPVVTKKLAASISREFRYINRADYEFGGTGMIRPGFIQILANLIALLKDLNYQELTPDDLKFFHKYYWTIKESAKVYGIIHHPELPINEIFDIIDGTKLVS